MPTQISSIANISNYKNISNIEANNWIFGTFDEGQLFSQLFGDITANNVTKCPLATPFVLANTTSCSQCPSNTPYFDFSLKQCVNCSPDTSFNQTDHACIPNPAALCPSGMIYNN